MPNITSPEVFKDRLVRYFETTRQGSWNRSAVAKRIRLEWDAYTRALQEVRALDEAMQEAREKRSNSR